MTLKDISIVSCLQVELPLQTRLHQAPERHVSFHNSEMWAYVGMHDRSCTCRDIRGWAIFYVLVLRSEHPIQVFGLIILLGSALQKKMNTRHSLIQPDVAWQLHWKTWGQDFRILDRRYSDFRKPVHTWGLTISTRTIEWFEFGWLVVKYICIYMCINIYRYKYYMILLSQSTDTGNGSAFNGSSWLVAQPGSFIVSALSANKQIQIRHWAWIYMQRYILYTWVAIYTYYGQKQYYVVIDIISYHISMNCFRFCDAIWFHFFA